jgi:hypothetical protein
MGKFRQQAEISLLDKVGGEPLEGSGFEDEIPDLSFQAQDSTQPTRKRVRSARKGERGDAE